MTMRYEPHPGVVEAVMFGGSTTQVHAIEQWIETGEYHAPGIVTCDIREMELNTPTGCRTVRIGDLVIRNQHGEFFSCPSAIFAMTYRSVE